MQPVSLRHLFDDGLLFELNRMVLHPLGMALALSWDGEDTNAEPSGVVLYRTDDPEGVIFAPETFREGDEKFQKFLNRLGGHKLAERNALVGFLEQENADQGGSESN
jgi:hypothetical protein